MTKTNHLKSRRRARELALQTMYAHEMGTDDLVLRLMDTIATNHALNAEVREYARKLVQKTHGSLDEIDSILQKHTTNWDLRRMAAIDRNILRIAVAELLIAQDDVPYKVIIDEAVEIAKTYSSDESGKFVNGIIDAIYRDFAALS
ncbi:MAG: transcription antitermination factor NusB [Fibrobacterota bacterium]